MSSELGSEDSEVRTAAREAFGNLPFGFEANRGQTDECVDFVARGAGYTLFLTRTEAVFAVPRREQEELAGEPGDGDESGRARRRDDVIRMRLVGAATERRAEGLDELPGRTNYLLGDDPAEWHTDVPSFAQVRYEDAYPGVDLLYYGNRRQLEYDFVVRPGADPSMIQMAFEGASGLRTDESGDLIVTTEGGSEMRHLRPVAYQEDETGRRELAGQYVVEGGRVGFRVGTYDENLPLVIDPVTLVYSSYLGGTGQDEAYGIAVDVSGAAYVTGRTTSINFPLANPFQASFGAGTQNAFVTKVSPSGSSLVYSSYLGGGSDDFGSDIAVDTAGAAYVTGYTLSTNFPVANAFQSSSAGSRDAFVAKVSPAGSALVYSSYLGGSGEDYGDGIAVDSTGAAYITGRAGSVNFPVANPFQGTRGGGRDAFVTKVNPAGSALVYSSYLGGRNEDDGSSIAVDASGAVYLAGRTFSGDFPSVNPFQSGLRGSNDAFVAKVNASGSALAYSSFLGGAGSDYGNAVAVDVAGAAYVTGETYSTDLPLVSPFQASIGGNDDAYVAKVSPTGSALIYCSYLGGSAFDFGTDVAVDASGAAYLAGRTSSTDFPVANPFQGSRGGTYDAFVAKIDPAGSSLAYSSYLGGSSEDYGEGIALDTAGVAYVAGRTASSGFPTASPLQGGNGGLFDAFVAKINDGAPGPGTDTVGLYVRASSFFFLKNGNSSGGADLTFGYGPASSGWTALKGDWDGDGDDTPGLYNPQNGFFLLRNQNSSGAADLVFGFGPGGADWVPLAGDWNGDGTDTIGLYNRASGFFFLRNTNDSGGADVVFGYGPAGVGWTSVVGDWDGDGDDTAGLYNPQNGYFFLKNANTSGGADLVFGFGPAGAGWTPLAGDWNGDGADTIGLYSPSNGFFFLKNTNASGAADLVFGYGPSGSDPTVGDWDGL